jgi:LuxR family transcriptional regulator, maltose regulon positive regulatory protein
MPPSSTAGFPIRTKLHPPVARDLVPRLGPLTSLCGGPPRRLTLVRAPAGWGKSSLLSSWSVATEESRPFAWLALDRADNDPVRFFMYLIESLRTLAPTIGEHAQAILSAPGISVVDDVLPVLINDLDSLDDDLVLAIEDYHLITSPEVDEPLTFLLDHAPAGLELVLTTRVEPALPIARLRARGELLEIATSELGFSVAEAEALLNEQLGLDLDTKDVSRLVERTEGWPAGLYLAALSLRGRADPHEFVEAFAGDERNVVDYLTTEVLSGLSSEVHDFLLSTSVLERLCASLCEEVTGTTGAARLLREIEVSNAFLIALDTRREWFRYHHLFRDLLRNELLFTDPERAAEANRRAGRWLRERGETSEAIHHAIAAGDTADAVELVASSWRPLAYLAAHQTIEGWLAALPGDVRRGDARLCVASAVVAIGTGRVDEVAPWIERAAEAPAAGPFHDGFASGPAAASRLSSVYSWLTGDLTACRESALTATGAGEPSSWDPFTHTWLGAATYWLGTSDEGVERLKDALERLRSAGHQWDTAEPSGVVGSLAQRPGGGATAVACLGMLGLVHVLQSDFDTAKGYADAAFSLSQQSGLEEYWVNTAAHTTRGTLLIHAGHTNEGLRELDRACEVARRGSGPVETTHAMVARGLAARAVGDLDAARLHVGDARAVLMSCPDPGPVISTLVSEAEGRVPPTAWRTRLLPPLVEEFSDRELEVLHLLGGQLSQREIGDHLYISFNTVKTHSKSIYRKLGVGTRAEAVGRAREFHLI